MRNILLYFVVKYEGDWKNIYQAISSKEKVNMEEVERVVEGIEDKCITILDNNYPCSLKNISCPPFAIFYRGNHELLSDKRLMVAVIGSRVHSDYGEKMTNKLVKELVEKEVIIISGLARGIDAIAHTTCLEHGGKTIAVLGSGIDVCYPKSNKQLYDDILKNEGLIISEYPSGINPKKDNFPLRNRLIAAFSNGILVVEAKIRSGTMITVNKALEIGKDIFCVPERASEGSGCNKLIKSGAKLTENVQDILEEFTYQLNFK